jgi:hypothetical protein
MSIANDSGALAACTWKDLLSVMVQESKGPRQNIPSSAPHCLSRMSAKHAWKVSALSAVYSHASDEAESKKKQHMNDIAMHICKGSLFAIFLHMHASFLPSFP